MDGRRFNGGHKTAGRKPKADEIKLIEELDKHIDQEIVFETLEKLIKGGNLRAIQLYFQYRFGRPRQAVEVNVPELQGGLFRWGDKLIQ